jgi:putative cell wall-binding protein
MLFSPATAWLVVLGLLLGLVAGVTAPPGSAHAAAQEDQVFSLLNEQRAAAGLSPLLRDGTLEAAAEEWANTMASTGSFVHSTNEWRAARIPAGWNTNGENIAFGYTTPAAVMDGWMNSPGHRENILRSTFTRVGIGYVANGNYWVQIFAGYPGDPRPPVSPPLNPAPVPTISGVATVASTLIANPGTWGPAPVNLSYQWNRAGSPIAGATSSGYVPVALDVGQQLSVSVTGSKQGYLSTTRASASTAAVRTNLAVDRVSGPDRYSGAVEISRKAYPGTAPVVYVVTGTNYPDALSAGPAAVHEGGPLLLTVPDSLPDLTRAEIIRLHPAKIVVVGGVNSVSDLVFAQLKAVQPNTVRISGVDRFETSRNVVRYAFAAGASSVYVVTGGNFPDALSAGAAGGALGEPVVLVDGLASGIDAETASILNDLGVESIAIAGGPNSVSTGIQSSLGRIAPTTRLSGADRFETSQSINAEAYTSSDRVFLATGYTFPDALAGSAWAGHTRAPLYVVPTDCVPQGVLSAISRLGATKATLLGGPAALTLAVQNLVACAW